MNKSSINPGVVLITGAAHRIGRAIALDMAGRGWKVVVHYLSSGDAAQKLVNEIKEFNELNDSGSSALAVQADLQNSDDLDRLMAASVSTFGHIDCLINNASLFEDDEITSLDKNSWAAHIDTNLRAPIFLSQSFAAQLPRENSGNIINIIDQRVWRLTPLFFSYTISKSALWTATRTMAQALAPQIRVNGIGPGPVMKSVHQSAEQFARQCASTPLGRGSSGEEIASAVQYILDAPSMTGQMIALDGGQHLSWRTADVMDVEG